MGHIITFTSSVITVKSPGPISDLNHLPLSITMYSDGAPGIKNPAEGSKRFNADDADLAIYSIDNVLFRIHSKNLETNTGAFPSSSSSRSNGAVHLPERGATLGLLFQFIYPECHPKLERLDLAELFPLAEAVQKYKVFPAMFVCHYRMGKFLSTNPLQLMLHAGRYGFDDYLDDAAPRLLKEDLNDAVRRMPESLYSAWKRYYGLWEEVHRKVLHYQLTNYTNCGHWNQRDPRNIHIRLGKGVKSLTELDQVFALVDERCLYCIPERNDWKQYAQGLIAEIPRFSTLL